MGILFWAMLVSTLLEAYQILVRVLSTYLWPRKVSERAEERGVYEQVVERQQGRREAREDEEAPAYRETREEIGEQRQLDSSQGGGHRE